LPPGRVAGDLGRGGSEKQRKSLGKVWLPSQGERQRTCDLHQNKKKANARLDDIEQDALRGEKSFAKLPNARSTKTTQRNGNLSQDKKKKKKKKNKKTKKKKTAALKESESGHTPRSTRAKKRDKYEKERGPRLYARCKGGREFPRESKDGREPHGAAKVAKE